MRKKVLIIGGTGFIGFHLAKNLKKNYKVYSLSNNKIFKNRIKGIKYFFFDINKKNNFKILNKYSFDVVLNASGYVNHYGKESIYRNQYLGLKNLIDYFVKKKIKFFLHLGSSAEYGKLKSPHKESNNCSPKMNYGKNKLKVTRYIINKIKKNSLNAIILRLYQVYGPYQSNNRFLPIIINKCLIGDSYLCHKSGIYRDFLYVDDLVDLISRILKKKEISNSSEKIFNVGYGKPLELIKVAKKIQKLCKGGRQSPEIIKLRKDETNIIFPDISNIKKVFKWKPKTSFEIGLNKTINYYQNFFKIN